MLGDLYLLAFIHCEAFMYLETKDADGHSRTKDADGLMQTARKDADGQSIRHANTDAVRRTATISKMRRDTQTHTPNIGKANIHH